MLKYAFVFCLYFISSITLASKCDALLERGRMIRGGTTIRDGQRKQFRELSEGTREERAIYNGSFGAWKVIQGDYIALRRDIDKVTFELKEPVVVAFGLSYATYPGAGSYLVQYAELSDDSRIERRKYSASQFGKWKTVGRASLLRRDSDRPGIQ